MKKRYIESEGVQTDDNGYILTSDVNTIGYAIPQYDTQIIDEGGAPAVTTITYKKSGVTVATKTITVSGTTTTIAVA